MLTRGSYRWTNEDEAKLRALAASGSHVRTIALRLRRSENSIKKRAHDLGIKIKPRPHHRFRIDEVVKGSR
jgi:hypothetical protein